MRSFFKNVLANIVAFAIIMGSFFVIFLFFLVLGFFSKESHVSVKSNSILVLNEKFEIIDSPLEDQDEILPDPNAKSKILIYDLLEAIKSAKTDDNIKGISIESDQIIAGITQLQNLRDAIEDFKKSGKFVYAYGNKFTQPSYYLASVAEQVFLNPSGGIELKGISSEVVFIKNFIEKYGIGVEIIRHGKYKSAVEPLMRNDISDENREQISTLINDIWNPLANKIMASRKLDSQKFKTNVDSLYGMIPDLALQNNLVDGLLQKSEYKAKLKSKLKLDATKNLNTISISKYLKTLKETTSVNEVAVLYASGNIFSGEGIDGVYSENLIKDIKEIAEDENIKSVVLRINSPGGSANASDEILFELQQLKLKKPLVVSFGDYAASGGYYIAMAADKIYAEPTSVTGSIGVYGVLPYFKNLANKNGINAIDVKTHANSGIFSLVNGATEGTKNILQKSVVRTYKRFLHFVCKNRNKTYQQIDEVGGGRVWSGTKAKEIGLVDELGSLHQAISFAAQMANIKDYKINSFPKKVSAFERFFQNMEEEDIAAKYLRKKLGTEQFLWFQKLTDPKLKKEVMMEMPFILNLN